MNIRLFALADTKEVAIEILDKILKQLNDYVIKNEIKKIEPYWKINGQFEIESIVDLKDNFTNDHLNNFLNNISNKWEYYGNPTEEALSSVTMEGCNFKIDHIYMINIYYT